MARNRTIYANEVLMVSPSATGYQFLNGDRSAPGESLLRQIKRLQSINYGYSIARTDTYQFGQLARIGTAVLESPSVNLDFSYYLTDGQNENLLGFDVDNNTNFLRRQVGGSDADGRNFFVYAAPAGTDAIGSIAQIDAQDSTKKSIISLGNCYVTNYSVNGAVGAVPMASVSVEGFSLRTEDGRGMTGRSPAINIKLGTSSDSEGRDFEISPEYITTGEGVSELLPGDIDISLGSASLLSLLADTDSKTSAHIQNFSLDIPMSRTTIQRVGNAFGFSKAIDLPITATVSVSAILADRPATSKSLFTELYENNKNDLTISFKQPNPLGAKLGKNAVVIKVQNATLDSENYGMSIGDNRTVDFTFSATIGEITTSETSSYVDINASGVYEQLQVLTTGMSTDAQVTRAGAIGLAPGFGCAVAANRDVLVIGASGWSHDGGDHAGAEQGVAYIYKNDKGFFRQANQVSGNNGGLSVSNTNRFPEAATKTEDWNLGAAVAVSSGSTVAVAAPNHPEGRGGIGFYEPNVDKTSWTLTSIVGATDMGYDCGQAIAFDKSVSGSSQLLFFGGPTAAGGTGNLGRVRLAIGTDGAGTADNYTVSTNNLSMTPPGGGDTNHSEDQYLGYSVAAHNGVVVAGAPGNRALDGAAGADNDGPSGAAFVWVNTQDAGAVTPNAQVGYYRNTAILTGTVWENGGGAHGSHPGFGADVDIYNDTIVVGAPSGNGGSAGTVANAGRVFVFTANDSMPRSEKWNHAAVLKASDGGSSDLFGESVAIPNANTIIVGAPGHESSTSADNVGALYVFTGYGANWVQTQIIQHTGALVSHLFGSNKAVSATQKEIFVGSNSPTATPEKVIRYRI